jgi:hypothetical protein
VESTVTIGFTLQTNGEDHVSGYPNLANNVSIGALFRNPSVQPATIRHLKSADGMGSGIKRLVWSLEMSSRATCHRHAWGFNYNGETRRILTTPRDGYMCFSVPTIGMAQVSLGAAAA